MLTTKLFRQISISSAATWLALFALVPNLIILCTSLLKRGESQYVLPQFSLEGYMAIMDPVFLKILGKSMYLASGATLRCLLIGYPFAYSLSKTPKKWRNLLLLLVIIPFWTNSLIRTYSLIFIVKSNGLISMILVWLGFADKPVSLLYTETAMFIGMTYTLLPFMILPLYSSLEKLDSRLVEAAHDLGAGRTQTFFRVILPLTSPGIIAGSMMVFLPALGMFYIPDLLGGGKNMLLGNFIKNQFLLSRNWPAGAAASVLLTLLMLVLMWSYVYSRKKMGRKKGGEEL